MSKYLPIIIGLLIAAASPATAGFDRREADLIIDMSAPVALQYITGPREGCYYINRNGNKTYVDRSLCRGR